jgi:hypothetical protein
MQLEIELAGNCMTIIKEIPDVCDWTHGRHPIGFEEVAGVDLLFTVGNDIGWNVRIYEPNRNGNNRSGGRWLVSVTDGTAVMEFWSALRDCPGVPSGAVGDHNGSGAFSVGRKIL